MSGALALAGCASPDSESSPTPSETATPTSAAQTPSDSSGTTLQFAHATNGAARTGDGALVASLINIRAANVPVGGSDGYDFRVRDDSDRVITASPDRESTVMVDGRAVLELYDGDGSLVAEPLLSRSGDASDVPLTVTGDTGMFQSASVFTPYTVELVDGADIVETTGPRVYGIGYEPAVSQDSTSGTIEVTMQKPDEYRDAWTVQLQIVNYAEDGQADIQVENAFDSRGDQLVTSFDAGSVAPEPDAGFRDTDLRFHVDGNTETAPNLWAGAAIDLGGS